MKQKITMIILFIGLNVIAQSKFEKGYVITNNGKKFECLIKNEDWIHTPIKILYKLNENSKIYNISSSQIKELSILNKFLFERHSVEINRYSNKIDKLSSKRTSNFKKETLLLKVLIKGEVSLLLHSSKDVNYFFYKKNLKVHLLEYKIYKTKSGNISKNLNYIKTLRDELNCNNLNSNIKYRKKELLKYFYEYNRCRNSSSIIFKREQSTKQFNLSGKLSFGFANYKTSPTFNYKLGLEIEYILPFNNNKWSVFIEPTYQSLFNDIEEQIVIGYSKPSPSDPNRVTGITTYRSKDIKYSSIEIPIAFRHYLFLKKGNKLFINSGFNLDFPINFDLDDTPVKSRISYFLGIGKNFKNKYSLELRYNTQKEIIPKRFEQYNVEHTSYSNVSLKASINLL